ncbi:MAG TPA: YceI family protein [Vicinamibacteria bacterium]|nr:YceI family protein [Vicinamibacteria bacterium]
METAVRRVAAAALAVASLAAPAGAAERRYVVVPEQSRVTVHVGRAGLFGFAGHEHEVVGPVAQGEVATDEEQPARSTVTLEFATAALKVTGRGEPAKDVPKVQEKMLGPEVLDAQRHPRVSFRSTSVSATPAGAGAWDLKVRGDLTLHGVTRPVDLPVRVTRAGDDLRATARTTIRHTDFGMKPVSVAGVVKVKNELTLEFDIAARAR